MSGQQLPPAKPPKPRNMKFFRATFAYNTNETDELSFEEGDLIYIVDDSDTSWWKARLRGKEGLVPSNFFGNKGTEELNPFHDACKRGNLDLLEECLANNVPINVPDKAGNTGLHWACRGGHEDCVARLLKFGPNINVNPENRLKDAPLHLAAHKGSSLCIDLLRSTNRIDVLKPNGDGKTAFSLAQDPATKKALKSWIKDVSKETLEEIDDYDLSDEDEENQSS